MKEEQLRFIFKNKITAILRGIPVEQAVPVARALYKGGIRLLEITFDQSSESGEEDTKKAIQAVKETMGKQLLVGAGTVLSVAQVEAANSAGAAFILTPSVDISVIQAANQCGMVTIPGAMTPTEIVSAYHAGADMVKIFPVDMVGGSGYLKAIMAPLNHIPMMAVGGIHAGNVRELLDTGIKGVGVASGLVDKNAIRNRQYEKLAEAAEKFMYALG